MHPARIVHQGRDHARAVSRNDVAKLGDGEVGAVLGKQAIDAKKTAPRAPVARNVEHRAGDLTEDDGAGWHG